MQASTTDLATTQSKNDKRFDEEFKREGAALASRPGATDEQVGRDLGVSAWSVARWRRRFGVEKRSGASVPELSVGSKCCSVQSPICASSVRS